MLISSIIHVEGHILRFSAKPEVNRGHQNFLKNENINYPVVTVICRINGNFFRIGFTQHRNLHGLEHAICRNSRPSIPLLRMGHSGRKAIRFHVWDWCADDATCKNRPPGSD